VIREVYAFPAWDADTPDRLIAWYNGHKFTQGPVRGWELRDRVIGDVRARLIGLGRDAAVDSMLRGRASIRAVPPFVGGAKMRCIGQAVRLGTFDGLFVQEIRKSESAAVTRGVIRWSKPGWH
jgi:hypothetical protein